MAATISMLQDWFLEQCDGDWEHDWGVRIETLDNPGWSVSINLRGTNLEGRDFTRKEIDRTPDDWYYCWTENQDFKGVGGPKNLRDILREFFSENGWH